MKLECTNGPHKVSMDILVLIPGLSKKYDDTYEVYRQLSEKENRVDVITNRKNMRTGDILPEKSQDGGLYIHRVFDRPADQYSPLKLYSNVRIIKDKVDLTDIDVIISSQQQNILLAYVISMYSNSPIISVIEHAFDRSNPVKFAGFTNRLESFPVISRYQSHIGGLVWRIFCIINSAIITSNPKDMKRFSNSKVNKTPVKYIPWPTSVPTKNVIKQKKKQGVYIGRLSDHKNIPELVSIVPRLLDETPTQRFVIVGNGKQKEIVESLANKRSDLSYIEGMPREDVLQLLSESYYSLSPAKHGSWGFIINSWAMKTPIVSLYNHYELIDGKNCMVTELESIEQVVCQLFKNDGLYERLQQKGAKRARNHRAERVSDEYLKFLNSQVRVSHSSR